MKKSYRHLLCLYPYRRELSEYGFCPPLGLEHIAASIQDMVDRTTIIDMRFEEDILTFVEKETDLVCISVNWDFEKHFFLEVIRKIPAHILTIVGGRYATVNVGELFEDCPNLDIVVRGDGEEVICELLEKGSPLGVAGLSYRQKGKVVHNRNRLLAGISDRFYPRRDLRRYQYKIAPQEFDSGIEFDAIASSRGCPYNCKFCTFSINPYGVKREWSARTPESIVEELKTVSAGLVGFTDDNFTHDLRRVEKLCELIRKEGIKKKFIINTRIDIARRPEILPKMWRAGFRVFLLGLESTSDKSLKLLNKGFTTGQVRKAFKELRRFPILYHGYFIIGNLGESEEEMLAISKFARELGVDTLSLSRLRCEKDSPLQAVIEDSPDYHIEDNDRVYSDSYPPSKLSEITRKVQVDFYCPSQMLRVTKKLIIGGLVTPGITCRLLQYALRKKYKRRKLAEGRRGTRRKENLL